MPRWLRPAEAERWSWAAPRAAYLRRAQVWLGGDVDHWLRRMRTLDVRLGPHAPPPFAPGELVTCEFEEPPGDAFLGRTPKFLCQAEDGSGETYKVKYGVDNGEVYAEVAATRLLWLLGFAADAVYPARVACEECAEDPWKQKEEARDDVVRVFDPATIEEPFPGRTIEERNDQGWTWDELEQVDAAAGGATRAQLDAFRLLAAFLQHRDSKAANQRMLCPPDADTRGARRDCRRPVLMIDDLGSTFGGPSLVWTHKMSVEAWEAAPVWKDARRCVADISGEPAAHDELHDPEIGDDGRRLLARLLGALSDAQLRELFAVARADRRGGVDRWVAAFRQRREAIARPLPTEPGFRCPG